MATKRVVLSVRLQRFNIAVNLISGHYHHHAHAVDLAHRVQKIGGSHRVSFESRKWFSIACAYQRLRRQMKNDFRPRGFDVVTKSCSVADIANMAVAQRSDLRLGEQVGRRRRRKRNPGHARAELREPQCQPRAFETGMTGYEDALAAPEQGARDVAQCQVFHGALPDAHRSSN